MLWIYHVPHSQNFKEKKKKKKRNMKYIDKKREKETCVHIQKYGSSLLSNIYMH